MDITENSLRERCLVLAVHLAQIQGFSHPDDVLENAKSFVAFIESEAVIKAPSE